ncbi:HAMP domain-containing sensor histidine kinase [Actinoplanes sp. NPDC051411]|uniref:sensor histidine kinase n=1 Tax=Actinoplanes sp. NPDC051411 TaxID=3155522 RepID=UPI00342228E9
MNRADPDLLLLRRARRILAIQHTAALAVILLIVGVVALLMVGHGQRGALAHGLRQTAASEEDVVDPPEDSWIFRLDAAGTLTATRHPPAGFPDQAAIDRVRNGGPTETASREIDGVDYLVYTRQRKGTTVQVVGSLAGQEAEQRRLAMALGAAGLLGLLGSAATGLALARRATAPLGDALDRQRRFVADASHELRTPLAQLHTRAQLLRRDLGDGPARTDLDRLVAGTRELGEVVDDLLLSTHGTAGGSTEVDLGVLAAAVLAAAGDRARDQDVTLDLVTDPDEPSLVRGREAALRRVLTALIDNALSHTPPGGHIAVELSRRTAPRQVTVTVRDDGSGFDPGDARHIFDRFARGHDDHRRFGLGLALAREVITGHSGTIDAHSTPGHGAVFTIRLPAG